MSVAHIACAADGGYAPHSAAMLHSLLAHRGEHSLHIHYLHGPDLPAGTAELLGQLVESGGGEITFLEIPEDRVADLPDWEYVTTPTWYRIYLPELLPDLDRILYLDIDTIVVDSIDALWETDIEGHYVGAVSDVPELDQLHRSRELGLSGPEAYFNAGVLLMNLDLMRRDDCAGALHRYALQHPEGKGDQDPINVVLGKRRLSLHPRWNCMNSVLYFPWARELFGIDAVEEARRRPAIRHFEGPADNKPWHYLCRWSMRELYYYHRQQTPWPTLELEGVTMRNRLKRLLLPWLQRQRGTIRVGAARPRR